jgi:SAM-dependent methyltransferase
MALLTPTELEERNQAFLDRAKRFEEHGHDQLGVPDFVLESAGPLEGPVLDLGTGKGVMARGLARRGFHVMSVDVSAEEQELAAFLTEDDVRSRIEFVEVDGVTLPFRDGTFGAAVTVNALHHLDDGAAALGELVRVVRPGGKIVLGDFSPEGFRMVADVRAAAGTEHPEGPVTMDWARGYLRGLGATEGAGTEGRFTRVATFTKREEEVPGAFAGLDRAGLLKALGAFAKNWLAHDGSWFLAAERRFGMEVAMELDAASWELFAAAEARRIMEVLSIPAAGGLHALEKALRYRMYSFINPHRVERSEDGSVLRFFMEECRVQQTRRRKGLPDFPCRPVGEVEFTTFARTVDPRIETTCIHCPPDRDADGHCGWQFRLATPE